MISPWFCLLIVNPWAILNVRNIHLVPLLGLILRFLFLLHHSFSFTLSLIICLVGLYFEKGQAKEYWICLRNTLFQHAQSLSVWLLPDPVAWGPSGSSVHGIFQARIQELVVISYSTGSSWPRKVFLILGEEDPLQWQADSLLLSHLGSPSLGQSRLKRQWGKNSTFKKLSESLWYSYCAKSPFLQMKSVDLHVKIKC